MALIHQVAYPGAVLVHVTLDGGKTLRVLFGAPPEVSRRLKADQRPGPDGKPILNYPDVVVCPHQRVVQDTPALCPEFVLFAGAFLGGRYNWLEQRMNVPLRWVGSAEELADLEVVLKECFLGVDERELRSRARSSRSTREMLLQDQRFFSLAGKDGVPHPLSHYCRMLAYDPDGSVTLEEGVRIVHHPTPECFTLSYGGEQVEIHLRYDGIERPMWADVYPVPSEPLRPHLFGLTVLGSDSAFSTAGPTTTNLLSLGGEFFLWDCSPFTAWILTRVGICLGDIHGIFVSHIHDDHVVDLYRFAWNGYRRMELITTAEIREQVLRKFSALWGVSREAVDEAFTWRLVQPGKAFLINGASITLHYGAHPIPSLGGRFEYRNQVFGLTGDTSSRGGPAGLDKQLERGLISPDRHRFLAEFPAKQFTLCDAGEATIHGFVKDFAVFDPQSIVLAHRSDIPPPFDQQLTLAGPLYQRCFIPSNATVLDAGVVSEVLAGLGNRLQPWVNRFLQSQPVRVFAAGETVVQQGDPNPDYVYLLLAGLAEVLVDGQRVAVLERGSFFGEQAFLNQAPRNATVVARSPIRVLPVPGALFIQFAQEATEEFPRQHSGQRVRQPPTVKERLERMWANRQLIASAFAGTLPQNVVHDLAAQACMIDAPAGAPIRSTAERGEVILVATGRIQILTDGGKPLGPGDVVSGLDSGVHSKARPVPAVASEPSTLLRLPLDCLQRAVVHAPALRRHLEEQLARRGLKNRLS